MFRRRACRRWRVGTCRVRGRSRCVVYRKARVADGVTLFNLKPCEHSQSTVHVFAYSSGSDLVGCWSQSERASFLTPSRSTSKIESWNHPARSVCDLFREDVQSASSASSDSSIIPLRPSSGSSYTSTKTVHFTRFPVPQQL